MVRHRRRNLVTGSHHCDWNFLEAKVSPCMHYNIFIELNRIQLHDRLGWRRAQL